MSVWVTWPALTKLGTLGIFAGLITLAMEREALFENNLFDTENYARHNADITCDPRSQVARTEDGTCNILSNPAEGSVYMRFGRNVKPEHQWAETDTLLSPNPREVSNTLLARGEFKPAPSLNFIAAAWIQFMTHDWFNHGENTADNPIQVPLPAGDPLGSGSISVQRTQPDPTRSADEAGKPQAFRNHITHWWDGSQIYGSDKATNDKIRSFVDGKLKVECPASYEDVDVLEMLDGIRVDRLPGWAKEESRLKAPPEPEKVERTIKIFLASSSELRADRDEFDLYFRQQNDTLRKQGIYLQIVRWENFLDAMSETRLQDEYNKEIRACDLFVSLFFYQDWKIYRGRIRHRPPAVSGNRQTAHLYLFQECFGEYWKYR